MIWCVTKLKRTNTKPRQNMEPAKNPKRLARILDVRPRGCRLNLWQPLESRTRLPNLIAIRARPVLNSSASSRVERSDLYVSALRAKKIRGSREVSIPWVFTPALGFRWMSRSCGTFCSPD